MAKKKTPQDDVFKTAADTLINTLDELGEKQGLKIEAGSEERKTALKNHEILRAKSNLTRFVHSLFRFPEFVEAFQLNMETLPENEQFLERLSEWVFAQYEQENRYIDEELKKPEYGGKTRAEIEADGINEDGKIYPESLYGKAWQAAINALELDRWKNLETGLKPYLQEELKKPVYAGRTIEDLREEWFSGGRKSGTLYEQAIDAADAAKYANVGFVTATIKRTDIIEYPLDKVNHEIWRLLEEDAGEQIALKAEKDGSGQQLSIMYSIGFEDLQGVTITKKLEPFDKRVYIAVSALFNAGNNVITLTQIHYAMGNSKRPNAKQLQKIYDSVRKMTSARVYVNNESEAQVYSNYPVFKYEGSLLPIESMSASVNGQLTNAAIHIFREPPIVSFAKKRNQLTTVTVSLLDSPISKTNGNLAIDDYLIERIARAKNGKQPCKILYETLYERCRLTTPKQKQRAPETIKRYLDHYKADGFITGYKQTADSITVFYADK